MKKILGLIQAIRVPDWLRNKPTEWIGAFCAIAVVYLMFIQTPETNEPIATEQKDQSLKLDSTNLNTAFPDSIGKLNNYSEDQYNYEVLVAKDRVLYFHVSKSDAIGLRNSTKLIVLDTTSEVSAVVKINNKWVKGSLGKVVLSYKNGSGIRRIGSFNPDYYIYLPTRGQGELLTMRTRILTAQELNEVNGDGTSDKSQKIDDETFISSLSQKTLVELKYREGNFFKIRVMIAGVDYVGYVAYRVGGKSTLYDIANGKPI